MEAKEVLVRSLEQSQGYLTRALDGLTPEEAAWRLNKECNSIAFILWHIARVEDYYINRVVRHQEVVYDAEGWREKLGTPAKDTGFGYTFEQLQAWPTPKLETLRGYANSVREHTLAYLQALTPEKLAAVPHPERSPDSVGAILTRIVTHAALQVGQIDYLRGMQRGLNK